MLRRIGPSDSADLARIAGLIAAHPLALLGQTESWLAEQAAVAENRILIWDRAGTGGFDGFAVLELAYPRVVDLMNLALVAPGRGEGQQLIRAVLDLAFGEMGAHRLFCDVAHDNAPALAAFRRAGLVQEGVMRSCWNRGGTWVDCLAFALLETEWRALPPQGVAAAP
ncbi:GNAT family N-acetyltransferase [Xinfangfangia pollutisoli]|uniref:GNAT family N-acetyltransferase n=1 Tax=Xinfangfangia pollutisoli TaxID=2865960 RepID=UPI001CD3D710|nr:GNAT family protein [Xinfangfangia pollutisoli]